MKNLRLLFFALFLGCFVPVLQAQTTVFIMGSGGPLQFFDGNGNPLNGGCIKTFAAGTSTPQATYTDSTGSVQNSNPIVLGSNGFPPNGIWLSSLAYKFQVFTAGGVNCATGSQIGPTIDNFTWTTPLSSFNGLVVSGNLNMTQPTAATGGANQSSFSWCQQGSYWTGSASATDKWCAQVVLGSGSNPTSTWTWTHTGSSGTASMSFGSIPLTLPSLTVTGPATTASANGVLTPACTDVAIRAALASVVSTGGIVDWRGCANGAFVPTITAPITIGAYVKWLTPPNTIIEMGSNTITMNPRSTIEGVAQQNTTFVWNADVEGIVIPAFTMSLGYGAVTLKHLQFNNANMATASHAIVHCNDCAYFDYEDNVCSLDSSAASACVRIQSVTSGLAPGSWNGVIRDSVFQRVNTTGGRATSGQISLDFVGNSSITDGDISYWTIDNRHMEGNTIQWQVFCGSHNKLAGGDLLNGAPSINITGNSSCNSNANNINVTLNGASATGSQGYTIDSHSNFTQFGGAITQQLVASTDAAGNTTYAQDTENSGGNYNFNGNIPLANNSGWNEISAGSRPGGVSGQDLFSGDSSSHCVLASFNGGSFTNNCVLAANTAATIPATFTFTGNQIFSANINLTNPVIEHTAPSIAAGGCGGSAASIPNNNGTAAFTINVGSTPGSACTVTMPAATTGWACSAVDVTTNSTSVFVQKQSPAASQTTTQIVITNFSDVAAATAFTGSDVVRVMCLAY